MIEYFIQRSKDFNPRFAFNDDFGRDFASWQSNLLKELKKVLGVMPEKAELNPQVLWEVQEDGLIKRKVVLQLEEYMSVAALIYIPVDALKRPAPAILCNHGHGRFGKDSVMGITSNFDGRRAEEIKQFNFDYGLQMAKRGYVTMAIDWRGFGERSDNSDPYMADDKYPYPGRDKCNVHFIRGSLMGINLLTLDVFDAMRCIDYLCSLNCVNKDKIGAMGLSFGGTMTTWISLLDERIKAADIICYSCCFKNFAIKEANFCGSQFVPGLFELCDVPDLQGLIAPKPLLAEIGLYDKCFNIEDALECSDKVKKIYKAAGASEKYEVDLFAGDHQFSGKKAFEFFDKNLKEIMEV
jgi:hypothetical protein